MSSDQTFITNETGNTLVGRLSDLLSGSTQSFDCLVGYFYLSGFHKIYRSLEAVDKIRILVGLETDHQTYKIVQTAKQQAMMDFESHAEVKQAVSKNALSEMEEHADKREVEDGILVFLDWLKGPKGSPKLEIRAYPTHDLHAKVYIMTFKEGDRDKGRVITGSSNLTQAGLQDNLEFNVELKNPADYEFARAKFEELWKTAVDVAEPYRVTIEERSPYATFTPYELYLKFLYEYFKAEVNRPEGLEDSYVPAGYKKLRYQEEAVFSAQKVLEEYGGVFLSDVVGLGKTYMAALLAQVLEGRCLVLAPPHLLDKEKRGSWPNVFSDFQVRQTDFESIGKLDSLLARDLSKYSNVFIDESHRFRTETNDTYEKLAQICRGKRVILVSATPLNNTPWDILSQLKLFQNGKNSTIPNLRNLESFFAKLEKRLKGLDRQRDRDLYYATVQENARETREKVLKYLMVRRTRTEIEKYYGQDMKLQGLKFPTVRDPQPLYYKFSKAEANIFGDTVQLLTGQLTYARYKPLTYYKGDAGDIELQGQRNLAKFMKILLIKRLESSFHAFELTVSRFTKSYKRVIAEYVKGNVYLSKKHFSKICDLLEKDDQQAIETLLEQEKAIRLKSKDFTDEFIRDLKADYRTLLKIRRMWAQIKRDPKWIGFRDVLKQDNRLKKRKLIIFTESQETAEYLAERIQKEVEPATLLYSGSSGDTEHRAVIANFDANAYQCSDDYRVLVCTEVLSEGVNLHQSNIVINYDIPWNPTRLIQRVGRVNRVDTKFDAIHTYNFFPTDESNDQIKLREAAEAKIHGFIEMLGADARLLTEGEEIKSHDLFIKINSKKFITGEDGDEESELEYLTEIRRIRDENPPLFSRIKCLPRKARSTRMIDKTDPIIKHIPALLTYFRQGKLDKFYISQVPGVPAMEMDFIATARVLKPSTEGEKCRPLLKEFYDFLEQNKAAFADATSSERDDASARYKGSANDAYIMKRLKAKEIRRFQGFTDDDETFLQQVFQLLHDGALPRPTTKKVAEALKRQAEPLRVLGILRRDISPLFFQATRAQQGAHRLNPREVILSSCLLEDK